ncbi:MAG: aspartate kinase [Alphaproteobacteria bacterium]|nr:aspartate kinase [Alphaproteobacteria bacterium]
MALLVLKFGGTSVGDIERIKHAAGKVAAEVKAGHHVAVNVSAMAGQTDQLVAYCRAISPLYDMREYDAVVSTGEQITSGLMALALQQRGLRARSWQGWQVPMHTDRAHGKARVTDIDIEAMRTQIMGGEVAVLAGFQGISDEGRITTLGRGGSDTSAVALAAALKADRCDIYTDVDGVYTTDPRIVPRARKLQFVAYEEMLEMASLGAKVLQTRSVELAMKHNVPLQVLSTFDNALGSEHPGTLVKHEDESMEQNVVTGVTYSRDEAKITVSHLADRPGIAAAVFGPLADANVNVDMIVQSASHDGKFADITFSVGRGDVERTLETLTKHKKDLGFEEILTDKKVIKVSVVGVGMRSHAGVAAAMFKALASKGINIDVISTSEIKVSVLVAEEYAELAVRTLHTTYGLDAE